MNKLTLIAVLLFYSSLAGAQQNILIFKKGNKTISKFWQGHFIAFQLPDKQWQKGEITRIENDSVYIRPTIVHYYLMGTDTVHYPVIGFAFADLFAMPKKGVLISYIDGRFQIQKSAGHMHWYWVKSGWLFRTAAIGYTALDVTNGLINDNYSFKGSKLGIAGVTFLLGVLLKRSYKPVIRLRRKYHLEILNLSK